MKFIFLFLLLMSMICTDLPLQSYFGTLAASPMVFVSTICSLFYLSNFQYNINQSVVLRWFISYVIVSLLVSFILLAYVTFIKGEYYSLYGDVLFYKLFRSLGYSVVFVLCLNSLISIIDRSNIDTFYKLSCFFFFFLLVVALLQFFHLYEFALFHNDIVDYDRIRLLSPEPSMAALSINVFGGISIAYVYKKSLKLLFILFLIVANLYIGSKVSVAYIVVSVFFVIISSLSGLKRFIYLLMFGIIIIPLFYYYYNAVLVVLFESDISNFTSASTRVTTAIWSFLSIIEYPFGQGYGTYLYFSPKVFNHAIMLANDFFDGSLNSSELYSILESGNGFSVKSGILSQAIYSGVIAIIFYFYIFFYSYKEIELSLPKKNQFVFKVIIIYIFLSLLLSVNIELMYVFLIPIAIISISRRALI